MIYYEIKMKMNDILNSKMKNKKNVKDNLVTLISKIGEKITLRRSDFFGSEKGFILDCFLDKKNLIEFIDDLKPEYENPNLPYEKKEDLPKSNLYSDFQ